MSGTEQESFSGGSRCRSYSLLRTMQSNTDFAGAELGERYYTQVKISPSFPRKHGVSS